jgi:hypothetical protein
MSRISSSAVAIASGMSIGREGPLIEFGGSLGAASGRWMRTSLNETRVLVAAGTAAGFAAAYNTPFAAILFVFETIIGIASPSALLPTMTATVIATVVTRALIGAGPIYGQRLFKVHAAHDLWWLLALGALAALVATAFKWVDGVPDFTAGDSRRAGVGTQEHRHDRLVTTGVHGSSERRTGPRRDGRTAPLLPSSLPLDRRDARASSADGDGVKKGASEGASDIARPQP